MPEQEPTINPEEQAQEEQEKAALYERQKSLVEQIKLARAAKDTTQLRTLFEELKRISLPKMEKGKIPPEVLEQSQALYDWLGIETNLQKEAQEGKIVLPSAEQQEAAEKEGYSLPLIILGELPREELLARVKAKYASEFKKEGIYYWEQAKKDLSKTQTADQNPRPLQPYLIYLKPQGLREAHLETMGETFPACQEILEQKQQANPQANLKGLTYPEYLIAEASTFKQTGKHLDENPWAWTWLLEEQVLEEGKPARCLGAGWGPGTSGVGVGSFGASVSGSDGGARFAALPAEASA